MMANDYGYDGISENMVRDIKQEAVSSGSSLYSSEEDAIGDVFSAGMSLMDMGYEMDGI